MARFTVPTYDDLSAQVRDQMVRSPAKARQWQSILDVISELAGGADGTALTAIEDRIWSLHSITVAGVRGVGLSPVTLELPPGAGITVVHGPNGSGKSSLCDALEVALHQGVPESKASRGTAALWDPILTNSETDQGTVEVVLRSGADHTLVIKGLLVNGDPVSFENTLIAGDTATPLELGSRWRGLVTASQPIFAYASWERRIQEAARLRDYIVGMLALGDCFVQIDESVKSRREEAKHAATEIETANEQAIEAITVRAAEIGLEPVDALFSGADPDAWWDARSLPPPGSTGPSETVDPAGLVQAISAAESALATWQKMSGTGDQLAGELAHLLGELDGYAHSTSGHGPCPVCGTDTDWSAHLHRTVERNGDLIGAARVWRQAMHTFVEIAGEALPVLALAAEPGHAGRLNQAVAALADLRSAGEPPSSQGHCDVLHLLTTESADDQLRRAIEQASSARRWKLEQATSLKRAFSLWQACPAYRKDAAHWREVAARLSELRRSLTRARAKALADPVRELVARVLPDSGFSVKDLSTKQGDEAIQLTASDGRLLKLATLSAGQRNALLLAPMLATGSGCFAFTVIDDPVHSLDELRIDRLGHVLQQLSQSQRVIVFTHDRRMAEQLAAHMNVDSRRISRHQQTGRITICKQRPMWRVLIEDAQKLVDLEQGRPTSGLMMTARGLCRQAVDNALRSVVLHEATRRKSDPTPWLTQLDREPTTWQRLNRARRIFSRQGSTARRVEQSETILAPFRDAWNTASHGKQSGGTVGQQELDAALEACQTLMGEECSDEWSS